MRNWKGGHRPTECGNGRRLRGRHPVLVKRARAGRDHGRARSPRLRAEVTASAQGNDELVRSLGAHQVIDYTTRGLHPGRLGTTSCSNNVLEPPAEGTARILAPGGLLIPNSIGYTGADLLAGTAQNGRAVLRWGLGRTKVRTVTRR